MRLLAPALLTLLALPAQAQFWSELANPKVEVTLVHPPGLGLKVDRLAFAPTRDMNSREMVDILTADLVQSRQVEVLDRAAAQLAAHFSPHLGTSSRNSLRT